MALVEYTWLNRFSTHLTQHRLRNTFNSSLIPPLLLPQQLRHPPSHLLNPVIRISLSSYGQALPFPSLPPNIFPRGSRGLERRNYK